MKTQRLLISLSVILLSMTRMPVMASEYSYFFTYMNNNAWFKTSFGTLPFLDAGEGYDYESLSQPQTFPLSSVALAIHKESGRNGWDGPTGFFNGDYRSVLQPGQRDIIGDIYLWAGRDATPQNLQLWIYESRMDPGLTYKLRLVQVPQGINYTGPREWGPNHGTISLPFFATDDFTKGYKFQAEITAVPEPSSLFALFGGLAGLGGAVIRRRR